MMTFVKSRLLLRFFLFVVLFVGYGTYLAAHANASDEIDQLLEETNRYLNTNPEKSAETLAKLERIKSQFNKEQDENYHLKLAISLGLRGRHRERIEVVQAYLSNPLDTELRVQFLYQMTSSYTMLAEYENALSAMNESIRLLPKLDSVKAKSVTLQSAITLLTSLHALDEAIPYAERQTRLGKLDECYGNANLIEINFLKSRTEAVQDSFKNVVRLCEEVDRKVIALYVKSIAAVDLINNGRNDEGIKAGLPLLYQLMQSNQGSAYLMQLEDALARAYIKRNDLPNAERFALRAYQAAKNEKSVQMLERTSETMATIKRAQGQLNSAIDYYDINLALKKKVLDDQLQKNLAYQRVKFDSQDKANQLTLLEQKNKILTVEKQLQYGKNQNLVLLTTLITVLVAVLGAWLMRTWRQKNLFRYSAQMDGLTQVSNRAHFIACCNLIFKRTDQQVSLVLFDMDNFKKINDTFDHASGDWVLKNVCAAIQKTLRKNDVFGRLGGEEFGLCLVDLTDDEVLACAERWRAVVEEINTINSGYQFSISASFGAASRGKHGLQSFEETLAAADKALYVSKNSGRNRVSVYE